MEMDALEIFKVDNDGVEYTQDEIFIKVIKRRYDSCLKIWSTRNLQMICAMNVFFLRGKGM